MGAPAGITYLFAQLADARVDQPDLRIKCAGARRDERNLEGGRGTIEEALFKKDVSRGRFCRRDLAIGTGRSQDIETKERRHPVGRILVETLPFRFRRRVRLHGLHRGRRNIPRGGIACCHAHSK